MVHLYLFSAAHYYHLVFRDNTLFLAFTTLAILVGFFTNSFGRLSWGTARRVLLPFFLFSALYIGSVFWSIDPERTQAVIVDYGYFVCAFLILLSSKSLRTVRGVMKLFWFLTILNAVVSLYYILVVGGLRGGLIGVDETVFNITSLLIGSTLICAPFILTDAFYLKPGFAKKTAALLVTFFVIWNAQSRGGLVIIPLIFVMLMVQQDNMKRLKNQAFVALCVSVALAVCVYIVLSDAALIFQSEIIQRIVGALDTYSAGYAALDQKGEDYRRLSMYLTFIENLRPTLIGTGRATFGTLNEINTGLFVPSHSILIDLYIELGVLGLGLFSWFVIVVWKAVGKLDAPIVRRAVFTGIVVALIYGNLQGIFYNFTFYGCLVVGLTLLSGQRIKTRSETHASSDPAEPIGEPVG